MADFGSRVQPAPLGSTAQRQQATETEGQRRRAGHYGLPF
jgi:hypothetical protein